MPRKRKVTPNPITNSLSAKEMEEILDTLTEAEGIQMPPRGRPRKTKTPSELADATIAPVSNGYIVQSTSTGKSLYVFDDLDKVFDFVRTALKPTEDQERFLKKI